MASRVILDLRKTLSHVELGGTEWLVNGCFASSRMYSRVVKTTFRCFERCDSCSSRTMLLSSFLPSFSTMLDWPRKSS